jgi:tRNA dimethylallyltransferase
MESKELNLAYFLLCCQSATHLPLQSLSSTIQSMKHELYSHLKSYLEGLSLSHQPGELNEKPLIVICGPTASGKTALSIQIAEDFKGEIVSADSAQIYRKMDIGTDKVTHMERKRIKHHLIDVRNPDQSFTMADFKLEATWSINDILKRGKLPILCGGTGLYIRAIVEGYELPQAPPNQEIRDELQKIYEEKGKDQLYRTLQEIDPITASKIHPNNVRYVARALEIVMQTKKPIVPKQGRTPYNVFKIAINWDREVLYERINRRIDEQIEEGLLNEIKSLLAEGYSENIQAFTALGYKEYIPYLKGEKPLEQCKEQLKQSTRKFAKRQLTWYRKEEDIYWIEPDEFFSITGKSPDDAYISQNSQQRSSK